MALTTDLWTSKTHHCFISLTMHYLDDKFRPKMMVLGCLPFADDHDAASIWSRINTIVNDYNIGYKIHLIVRDNAHNIFSALEHSDWDHVGCYLHILQLAVIHATYEQPGVKTLLKKCSDLVECWVLPPFQFVYSEVQKVPARSKLPTTATYPSK